MPPPRPRKLLARKSLATDPSLYLPPVDSDEEQDTVAPLPGAATTSVPPSTKRRSARLSIESAGVDSPNNNKPSRTATARAKAAKSPAVSKGSRKDRAAKGRGKARVEESEEEGGEETREEVRDALEGQEGARGGNKRAKVVRGEIEPVAVPDTRLLVSWFGSSSTIPHGGHALM